MRLRIVDYVGNPGGGMRFALQMIRALCRTRPQAQLELVSFGEAADRYRRLLREHQLPVSVSPIEPEMEADAFRPPAAVIDGCDRVWLPWQHRHLPPESDLANVVTSFHDAILFEFRRQFASLMAEAAIEREEQATLDWFRSDARIVISSCATRDTLNRCLGVPPDRFDVIPISAEHEQPPACGTLPSEWTWIDHPFLLCPANVCPHKNHETLLRAFGTWGARHPLALCGSATHLHLCKWSRSIELRDLAASLGLDLFRHIMPLGYVSDGHYAGLLERAWALVMPTLAEGGGSFPVAEALLRGVPVLCSDIPVLREQVDRMNGQVLWFDPHDPADLAAKLEELHRNYPKYKQRAAAQIAQFRRRSWTDVAEAYWRILEGVPPANGVAHVPHPCRVG